MADAISSGSCPIFFKVLTLNVAICIVRLHLSNFCLSSETDFSKLRPGLQPQQDAPFFFTRTKRDAVWTCGLSVGHVYLSMAVFILIHRSHTYR